VVEQTSTLFAGTIFENIAMGREGATQREVIEAAIMVCFHLFLFGLR
jgi:ABC-type multidrug transport system fused ATPase/permease subunit